jgi:BirA family biotin operon repressor/biotin-[acetyl-CoA-carboxylase] ligase
MSTRYRLIELLADGQFRSGEWLGRQLGISRAAVWKQLRVFCEFGLDVHAVPGQGYRLFTPFQPLSADLIRLPLSASVNSRLDRLDVLREIDSTSDYLKRKKSQDRACFIRACAAEWQSSGRGRRGRRWVSPYGTGLYLSLAMQLGKGTLRSGGLSLAAAVAVLRVLQDCGIDGLGVKWPNDIFYQGRKIAGILLDLSGESSGPFYVVLGIGINLKVPESAAREIDQPWADLSQCGVKVDRNYLAGMILEALVRAIETFGDKGLEAFIQEWNQFDLISGCAVELHHDKEPVITGVARGIDASGALLIENNGVTSCFHAGEVSVRVAR